MGIFGWLKPEEEPEDRSLIEISNDSGDHYVANVPSDGVAKTERALRDADVERDKDDQLSRQYNAAEKAESRDKEQYRYRSEPVVNSKEDLEAEVDDDSILERNEQPSWWPF